MQAFSDCNVLYLLKAARWLKLPLQYHEKAHVLALKLGKKKYFFRGGHTPFNEASSANLCLNKYCVNLLLKEAGFPVPSSIPLSREAYFQEGWSLPELSYPLVAKPTWGTSCGRDVLCKIEDETTLVNYLDKKTKKYDYINVEPFIAGLTAYRVLVFYKRVIGVLRQDPAQVKGDGKHSIGELIAFANQERAALKRKLSLGLILIDEECQLRLKENKLTLASIPALDESVFLSYTCNSSRGGGVTSLEQKICPENADLLCRAAQVLNLNLVGFDVLCEDLAVPIEKSRGFIIEANSNPDLSIHEAPLEGKPRSVSRQLLLRLIFEHPFPYFIQLGRHYAVIVYSSFYFRLGLTLVIGFTLLKLLKIA